MGPLTREDCHTLIQVSYRQIIRRLESLRILPEWTYRVRYFLVLPSCRHNRFSLL